MQPRFPLHSFTCSPLWSSTRPHITWPQWLSDALDASLHPPMPLAFRTSEKLALCGQHQPLLTVWSNLGQKPQWPLCAVVSEPEKAFPCVALLQPGALGDSLHLETFIPDVFVLLYPRAFDGRGLTFMASFLLSQCKVGRSPVAPISSTTAVTVSVTVLYRTSAT